MYKYGLLSVYKRHGARPQPRKYCTKRPACTSACTKEENCSHPRAPKAGPEGKLQETTEKSTCPESWLETSLRKCDAPRNTVEKNSSTEMTTGPRPKTDQVAVRPEKGTNTRQTENPPRVQKCREKKKLTSHRESTEAQRSARTQPCARVNSLNWEPATSAASEHPTRRRESDP